MQQLGEYNGLVDVPQRVVPHALVAQRFQGVHTTPNLPMSLRTCSPADRWFVIVTPSILMEVTRRMSGTRGGRLYTACLHLEFVKMISVDSAPLSLRLLFCAHRSTFQFGRSGAGISSWDNNIRIISVLDKMLSYRRETALQGAL